MCSSDLGYYMTRDPLGRSGDFVTSPEVSQVFGELMGLWAAAVWQLMGQPENVRLVELGPGRGTMMLDAIRAAQAPHHFLSVTKEGHSAIVSTSGNEDCHIILRGGKAPNYDAASVDAAARGLAEAGLAQRLMVDFSHSNSSKNPQKDRKSTRLNSSH